MPAYRAARTIQKTYREIPAGCFDEVLVVDDASPDDTCRVAEELSLPVRRHSKNRGYGGNQKSCYDWALERARGLFGPLATAGRWAAERLRLASCPVKVNLGDILLVVARQK